MAQTLTAAPKVLKDGTLKVTAGDRVMYTNKLESGALAGTTVIAYVPLEAAKAEMKFSITQTGSKVTASTPETPADAESSPALEAIIAAAVEAALKAQS
jgi:uncharacterized RmlC-like cupin family protein